MQKLRHTSKRLNLRLLCSALLLVLFVCCSSMALAASQVDISQPGPTISVPLSDWNKLKERLMIADASIESSTKSLEQANSLTVTQTTELKELKEINEKQGQELAKASSKITEQEQSLTLASNSLDELKNEIKNNRRTEQRLRRQRDTWAVGGVIGFLIGAASAIR